MDLTPPTLRATRLFIFRDCGIWLAEIIKLQVLMKTISMGFDIGLPWLTLIFLMIFGISSPCLFLLIFGIFFHLDYQKFVRNSLPEFKPLMGEPRRQLWATIFPKLSKNLLWTISLLRSLKCCKNKCMLLPKRLIAPVKRAIRSASSCKTARADGRPTRPVDHHYSFIISIRKCFQNSKPLA